MTLAEKARAAAPVLSASDAEGGARGRLTEEAWQALQSIGVMRALQPARWGGGETSIVEYVDAIIEIGRHSASAGWVASVVGVHPWQIALFPEETQAELWGETPDRAIASSYTPTGKIEKVDGGYRVSGRWSFSSGIEWCEGVILGGIAGTREINGVERPDFTAVILDRADYTVERTWDVAACAARGATTSWWTACSCPNAAASRTSSTRTGSARRCPARSSTTARSTACRGPVCST